MYKLLFVDDESIYKLAIRSYIDWDQSGFEIAETADNGYQALEYLKKTSIDAVITDLEMPVMNGVTLIQKLREQGFTGPILALSNYSDYERVRGALLAGAFDYLIKVEMEPPSLINALQKMKQLIETSQSSIVPDKQENKQCSQSYTLNRIAAFLCNKDFELTTKELLNNALLQVFPSTACILEFPCSFSVQNNKAFLESIFMECFREEEKPTIIYLNSQTALLLLSETILLSLGTHLPSKMIMLNKQINMVFSTKTTISFFPGVLNIYDLKEKLSFINNLNDSYNTNIKAPLFRINCSDNETNPRESSIEISGFIHSDMKKHLNITNVKPQIAEAVLLINQKYNNRITLEYLAKQIGLTKEYLCRLFLKETGSNISQYVLDIRMEKASNMLLTNPGILIKEVAIATGFASQYAFSKKFKEYFGINPARYCKTTISKSSDVQN